MLLAAFATGLTSACGSPTATPPAATSGGGSSASAAAPSAAEAAAIADDAELVCARTRSAGAWTQLVYRSATWDDLAARADQRDPTAWSAIADLLEHQRAAPGSRCTAAIVATVRASAARLAGAGAGTATTPTAKTGGAITPQRIAIVGASLSAGLAGTPLLTAMQAAAPGAQVTSAATIWMFRDAVASGTSQVDAAIAARADLVLAIDFLFWHAYNASAAAGDRVRRVELGLADLERARQAGAAIVVGDVPRIVTASELLIPAAAVPSAAEVADVNAAVAAWASTRTGVLVVPFASWSEPLATGAEVELGPGELVPARTLMAPDGLHPNPLGVWYVLTRVDAQVERHLGVPASAWTFTRPPAP